MKLIKEMRFRAMTAVKEVSQFFIFVFYPGCPDPRTGGFPITSIIDRFE
jgi:hypothetical protein